MDEIRNEKCRDELAAVTAAIYIICWPIGLALLIFALFHQQVLFVVSLSLTFAILCGIGMLVGLAVGVIAHKLCYGTSIRSKWISVAVAALIDVSVFGWIVVISHQPGW
jgi:NhaP-type Na+/H+ or K+/H+ antiporter